MMGKRFARIVEECLHRLDRGENLPDVLADYPADAEHLKPLLLVAMATRSMALPLPSQTALRQGRRQMLAEMDQVGSGSASTAPIQYRVKRWTTRLVNALRARGLFRPSPSYRLAMIALLVIFGSGWFVLYASASPGDFLTVFAADIQAVLDIFDGHSSVKSENYFRLFTLFSENYSPFSVNLAPKVAFQLDFPDDTENTGNTTSTGGRTNLIASSPDRDPGDVPNELPDQDPDQIDLPPPSPFPGAAADIVDEVVSDTAKEKNPVWDELPFNQIEQDTSVDSDDQDLDEEKIKDKKPKKEKIIIPGDDD